MKKTVYPLIVALCLISASVQETQAKDLFGLWVKPRLDFVSGTGDVFKRFEGSPSGGAELGVTLLGVSLWGDIGFMSDAQYWSSFNLGYDHSFGGDLKLTIGVYAGLLWFQFPESEPSEDEVGLTSEMSSSLMNLLPMGVSFTDFEGEYNQALEELQQVANNALGVNARARLALEYQLSSFLSIGVQGLFGYHYILSGDDAASSAKSIAIDAVVDGHSLSASAPAEAEQLKTALKETIGAEDVELEDLSGLHYSVGGFVNLSF